MFNNAGIRKTVGAAPVQILFNVQNQLSVGIIVDDGYYVTRNGRKIVPAGTPLSGSLTARGTAFVKASDSSVKIGATVAGSTTAGDVPVTIPSADVKADQSDAVGVLLHDVDVTDGDNNGTLLIWGFVDLTKLDSTTAALITDDVKAALNGKVTFLN